MVAPNTPAEIADFLGAAITGISAFLGWRAARRGSKRVQKTQIELGNRRMALAEEMAAWFKQQEARSWQAMQPHRDIGYKALDAIDEGLGAGRFVSDAAAPPPSWRGTPSSDVVRRGGDANFWPESTPRPEGV